MKTFKQYLSETSAEAKNIAKGLAYVYNTQKKAEKNFPVGSKVKDRTGQEHEVTGHDGMMVRVSGGEAFHHTKITKA